MMCLGSIPIPLWLPAVRFLSLFPKGNKVDNQLSVYLAAPRSHFTALQENPTASFKLTLISSKDSAKNFRKGGCMRQPSTSACSWGILHGCTRQ